MDSLESLVGVPFKYGARPDEQGNFSELDCYGLVCACASLDGQSLPLRQFAEQGNVIAKLIDIQMDEWRPCEAGPGSVILFKILGAPCHVGYQISETQFIHTWERTGGVCIENIDAWSRRIEGHYRYVGS